MTLEFTSLARSKKIFIETRNTHVPIKKYIIANHANFVTKGLRSNNDFGKVS